MRVRSATGILALMALATTARADSPRLDGNWEVYMEMSTGDPNSQGTRLMTTHCVTKKAATDPTKLLPESNAQDCKVSDYKTEGNKVSWAMACEGSQPMRATVEFVYDGDTYEGQAKMSVSRGGLPTDITMKYSGKRMGDCEK